MNQGRKTIIGIIGTISSGKDTAAEYISKKLKIPSSPISEILRDLAKEDNIEPTRENLIKIGNSLVKEKGPDHFARLALNRITGDRGIITGMRILGTIEYMRANSNLALLVIEADTKVRFERSVNRNKLGEATTLEEFIQNEKTENSLPNLPRVFECLKLADYSILNNSDLEAFHKEIDLFLNKFNLE